MKKLLFSIATMFIGLFLLATPVHAECIRTSILGGSVCDANNNEVTGHTADGRNYFNCSCDDGDGSGIKNTLKLVVDIMSIGIGILAVIGITISGIQYLTAGGNEEKTRKAKRRIFEIVIGILVYVLIYAALYFLVPDFNPNL